MRNPLPETRKDELRQLIQDGKSINACADHFDCAYATVQRRLKEWQIPYSSSGTYRVSEEEKATIIQMVSDGMVVCQCSEQLGIPEVTIYSILHRAGISLRSIRSRNQLLCFSEAFNRLKEGEVVDGILVYRGQQIARISPL